MNDNKHQKIVDYHRILTVETKLNQLLSWHASLRTTHDYFHPPQTLSKQKIQQYYYANAIVFDNYYHDAEKLLEKILIEIEEMKAEPVLRTGLVVE